MKLPLSAAVVDHLEILPETGSTNDDLVAKAAGLDDFSVIVTGSQTAGRGRLGRVWVAPPGASLAISVLLRPVLSRPVLSRPVLSRPGLSRPGLSAGQPLDSPLDQPLDQPLGLGHFGWLPLIAGIAMTRAVQSLVPAERVGLKWPNDVQIDGLKVAGLLAELLPTGDSVVMGAGLNLSLTREQLPTPVSTSLELSGATLTGDELADAALSAYLTNLRELYTEFVRLGGDADGSGVAGQLAELCTTIGHQVKVELPGADDLVGVAVGIDSAGRLQVRGALDGLVTAVAAGDVTHLRYE